MKKLFALAVLATLFSVSAHAERRCDERFPTRDAYSGGSEYSLGDCDGSVWVDRISANTVKIHVKNNKCSNIRIVQDSGYVWQGEGKLDTSRQPFVSRPDLILVGHYFSADKAELEFSSNKCKTGVRLFVHF